MGLRIGCLYNANIHRKPSCAAKLTHLIDNLKSKNNGLVWDEVRWHGSLRSSNPRHLGVLREYHNSIRNEEDSSMNITVIRRISRFLSCALQPTEASDVSKHGRLFATGIVHHWNTKVVFIETKKNLFSLFSRPVRGVSQHPIFRTGRLGGSFIYN